MTYQNTADLAPRDLLARLNPQQTEAVCLGFGPSLIIAGAGSGKTTVLTRRIAYLITQQAQDIESILAVTFTNKAAAEMKHRIETLIGESLAKRLSIGTFHSICARILRREIESFVSEEGWQWGRNFVIYDEIDSVNLLKGQIAKLNLDEKVFAAKEIKHAISSFKNDGFSAQKYTRNARTYRETRLAEIYTSYQAELARNNALDFDDLILVFTELLRTNVAVLTRLKSRFRHILVDEFQDTNQAQYQLVKMLAGSYDSPFSETEGLWSERSLMVVGDVDQSIYSWRKADFRIILGFQNDYKDCRLIKLEENYRSTETILAVANSIIANNSERLEKVLRCNRDKGSKVQCYEASDEIDESFYIVEELKRLKLRGKQFADCVILYRTNAQSRAIEEILVRNHIPYTVIGATRFYDRQEIKDVLAYLKLIFNERDGQAFHRVINVPKRGLGKTTIDRLVLHAEEHQLGLIEACQLADNIPDVSTKSAKSLKDFANLLKRWQLLASATSVSGLLDLVLKETGYVEKLEEDARSAKDELALGRIDNIKELLAVAKEFEAIADEPDLDSFLTRISLVSDLDTANLDQDAVKMMTLHSAKGLEFPVVFLMGLEEGLFPHVRSFDSPGALEEERRLMYVGVTRAADLLYMTLARRRMMLGKGGLNSNSFVNNYTIPSRFLKEVTPGLLVGFSTGFNQITGNQSSDGFSRRQNRDANNNQGRFGQSRGTAGSSLSLSDNHNSSEECLFERLNVGDQVQHAKFGLGEVTQIIGEKDKELYNVNFQSAGKRLLDPRFAKLIKLR